jgi:hypothetical protein
MGGPEDLGESFGIRDQGGLEGALVKFLLLLEFVKLLPLHYLTLVDAMQQLVILKWLHLIPPIVSTISEDL